jgi:hypothetical protein
MHPSYVKIESALLREMLARPQNLNACFVRAANGRRHCGKYPEVHGKVVDFITHTIDDGTLYFTVRFMDQTSFCVRYACDMFAVGAELSDWQTGDFHIIREYMRPIPR